MVDERVPFPFHSNDNHDEYHRRELRTYFLEEPQGTNNDLGEEQAGRGRSGGLVYLGEEQAGRGRSGGLVYAVLLHRSSFEFEWWWCAVRRFVTTKRKVG